ncbi:hypothetical protein [Pseudomonas sp. EL_65y_Pfl1_R32]|uniref:hypothetical protein n=1 Tax=Pseudomonas sp. EL_65y_Pfl1_R32 TaxID=3088696 RepID=UPI0030DD0F93
MTVIYDGLQFRTRLEAQWAAFFDLAGWEWRANPAPVGDWLPDFRVTFPCTHSECGGSHTLVVAVLSMSRVEDFNHHPCLTHIYGIEPPYNARHPSVDAGAAFGTSPKVTSWEFSHGAGGGMFNVEYFVDDADLLWAKARNNVEGGSASD